MSEIEQTPAVPPPESMPPAPALPPMAVPVAGQKNGLGVAALVLGLIGIGGGIIPAYKNGLGVATLVLDLIGLGGGFILPLSGIGSILAIIFGAIGLKRVKRGEASNKGMALWGMWLGIAGVAISFFMVIGLGILMATSK